MEERKKKKFGQKILAGIFFFFFFPSGLQQGAWGAGAQAQRRFPGEKEVEGITANKRPLVVLVVFRKPAPPRTPLTGSRLLPSTTFLASCERFSSVVCL